MKPAVIKVCGITRPEDAAAAVACGAAFVGLNFWPRSSRYLPLERAAEVAQAAGPARVVGVFVNASEEEVERAVETAGLDLVQLHGDESRRRVEALGARALRVLRLDPARLSAGADTLEVLGDESWDRLAGELLVDPAAAFVFELAHSAYGGVGRTWNFAALAPLARRLRDEGFRRPLLLAGGLRPDNAAAALAASGFDTLPEGGVDLASGVESRPGIKDPVQVRALCSALGHPPPSTPLSQRLDSHP